MSISGNPRFRVYFDDGSSAVTQSDASINYDVENLANCRNNHGYDVEVSYSKRGTITDMVIA
jgi:hypothetical protein